MYQGVQWFLDTDYIPRMLAVGVQLSAMSHSAYSLQPSVYTNSQQPRTISYLYQVDPVITSKKPTSKH